MNLLTISFSGVSSPVCAVLEHNFIIVSVGNKRTFFSLEYHHLSAFMGRELKESLAGD